MSVLPRGFAEQIAEVLEPGDRAAAADIIEAATALDDAGLRRFLDLFANRVRGSGARIRKEELQDFLEASRWGGRSSAP